jgi:hypothetical protein
MSAPDGSPCGAAMAGLTRLLESQTLNAIKDRVNNDAAGASRAAVAKIVDVVREVLDAADTSDAAPNWLAAHGFDIAELSPPPPIAGERLR